MNTDPELLTIVKKYLEAVESEDPEASLRFFAPDVLQEELPNRLVPAGAKRDLAALRESAHKGRKVVSAQRYEIRNALVSENRVAVEAIWTGTLAIPLGAIPAGGQMRAQIGIFLEFRDGLIIRQRNYDCFDAF